MEFPQDTEDTVIDKLKDDLRLNVVMSSGKEYSISMASALKLSPIYNGADLKIFRFDIYERWRQLQQGLP
jgi:hypothetical protein